MRRVILDRVAAIVLLGGVLSGGMLYGQEVDTLSVSKTVEVERTYEPTLVGAEKISFMPAIADSTAPPVQPFEYHLLSRQLFSDLSLRPVPAATLGNATYPPLDHFLLRLGYGNYISPEGQLYFGSGRHDLYSYSLNAEHGSSWGKVALFDGAKVAARYSQTTVGGQAFYIADPVLLGFSASYRHRLDNFYGRDTLISARGNPYYGQDTQSHTARLGLTFESLFLDSSNFNYNGRAAFRWYSDNRSMREAHTTLQAEGFMYHDWQCYGAALDVDHYYQVLGQLEGQEIVLGLRPWVRIFGKRWRIQAGVQLLYEGNWGVSHFHVYPQAHLSYDIVGHYVIPYLEVGGGLTQHSYAKVREENPWITPGLRTWNSSEKLGITLGIKGNESSHLSYDLNGRYALVDSAQFYVGNVYDSINRLGGVQPMLRSDFQVVRDNVQQVQVHGELLFAFTSHLRVGVAADFWYYVLEHQPRAWHRPLGGLTLSGAYNLQRKIYVGLEFYLQGGAVARTALSGVEHLPLRYDLNLTARYRFIGDWSVYLDVRNILACKAQTYYRYPLQRFNASVGVVWAF